MKALGYTAVVLIILLTGLIKICRAQSEKIDSLIKLLPTLKDSAKIDCLNALSDEYGLSREHSWMQLDSAEKFAVQALKEAKEINYIHGIAAATSLKAGVAFRKYTNYFQTCEFAREAIRLYEKTPNKKRLNQTHIELGLALWAQSSFEAAVKHLDTGYTLSKKEHNLFYIFFSITALAGLYTEWGNYSSALDKAFELKQFISENYAVSWKKRELEIIGDLYWAIEDYDNALMHYLQAFQLTKTNYNSLLCIAELFSLRKQFDSADYYYRLVDTNISNRALRFYLASKGENYFLQYKYEEALSLFLRSLNYSRDQKVNDVNQVMRVLVNIAKTHLALRNTDSGLYYAYEVLGIARQKAAKTVLRDSYGLLYSLYNQLQQKDSALYYQEHYLQVKDSIASAQIAAKLIAYDFNRKLELLDKEKQIQQAKLQRESLLRKILIAGIFTALLVTIIIFRNIALKRKSEKHRRELLERDLTLQKLENEKTKAELQQQATELEMQALRAQMNPHFIFNSLNSVNRFILTNDKAQASEYLTKFSRLIRLILQNSKDDLISLENELESLQLYIELEAVRFDHRFDSTIAVDPELDISLVKIPPLIIQPFAENAVWHGLMHREGKGHLAIEVSGENEMLNCKIRDNGVGRTKAAELKSKSASTHKSMGMQITADRIAIMKNKVSLETYVQVTDLVLADGSPGGTEVLLRMPLIYSENS